MPERKIAECANGKSTSIWEDKIAESFYGQRIYKGMKIRTLSYSSKGPINDLAKIIKTINEDLCDINCERVYRGDYMIAVREAK